MASFILQIDFVTLAAKELSRAAIGECRTTFFSPSVGGHCAGISRLALQKRKLKSPTTCLFSRPAPENA